MIQTLFDDLLVKPFFNAFLFLYLYIPGHDFGVVVILFTVLVRIVLWPLFSKSILAQTVMTKLQPEIEAIQHKYKDDKQVQVAELMKLYKANKFNPFSGFFSLFIQLPILIAVYRVFQILGGSFDGWVYPWLSIPDQMNHTFLGMFDLLKPFTLVTLLASLLQFGQVFLSMKAMPVKDSKDPGVKASRMTAYLSPILTFVIFRSLPSVLSLYWSVSSLVSIVQQFLIQKKQTARL